MLDKPTEEEIRRRYEKLTQKATKYLSLFKTFGNYRDVEKLIGLIKPVIDIKYDSLFDSKIIYFELNDTLYEINFMIDGIESVIHLGKNDDIGNFFYNYKDLIEYIKNKII